MNVQRDECDSYQITSIRVFKKTSLQHGMREKIVCSMECAMECYDFSFLLLLKVDSPFFENVFFIYGSEVFLICDFI